MFVTFFLGVLNLSTGELRYSNAGHNPPVIIRDNGEVCMFEKATCVPVGLFEEYVYGESALTINPGDKIFLYTDGVSEAENINHELFGEENLLQVLRRNTDVSPRTLIHQIEDQLAVHVNGYTQSDDITMMTIVFNKSGN